MTTLIANVRSAAVLCSILLCSVACGSDLSRADARRQISRKLQLPATQTTRVPRLALNRATSVPGDGFMPAITICQDLGTQWADVRSRMETLQQKGLVTLGRETRRSGNCTYEYTTISLTSEGQRYLVAERGDGFAVRTHTLTFGDVTGIRVVKQLNVAQAEYTLRRDDITPFAEDLSTEPVQRSATFQRYDDGWRIE
jgi:hypothetical protein